jgi:hypothetical protein
MFSSHLLATGLNTETSTSGHYEVFLPFFVPSPWNLGTQLKTLLSFKRTHVIYCSDTDNAENTVLLLRTAGHTENTSHVTHKHCLGEASLRQRRSVFTEPLHRSGLHDLDPLLHACITGCLSNRCLAVR